MDSPSADSVDDTASSSDSEDGELDPTSVDDSVELSPSVPSVDDG